MAGCGGFCGGVDTGFPIGQFTNNLNWGLLRGYAAATTDSGHDNMGLGRTYAEWAFNNRPAEIDWGYRSIHEVTRVSKALICVYYGQPAQYSYFAGCSTGGRQAMVEVLRFPEDFDGVISGAPALDYTGLVATWMSWIVQGINKVPLVDGFAFDSVAVNDIRERVLERCDDADGDTDGLICDPRRCPDIRFKGLSLTKAQLKALDQIYSKPREDDDDDEDILYEGVIPYGSEIYWPIWVPGMAGTDLNPLPLNLIGPFNDGFLKYMAFKKDDPDFTADDFDFDDDPERLKFMGRIYNATGTNISKFKQLGGKILMYHGWADSIVPPLYTVDYYDRVVATMGGLGKTQDFFRLFMVPGMDHCSTAQSLEFSGLGTSIGLDNFDALGALENWVEKGIAPDSLWATGKSLDGVPVEKFLYPYAPDGGDGDDDDDD